MPKCSNGEKSIYIGFSSHLMDESPEAINGSMAPKGFAA